MTATELEFKKGETVRQTLSKGESYTIAAGKYEYSISGKDLVITKKEGEGTSEVTSKIVLKNYATKDVSNGVKVGEDKLEDVASLPAIHRKNSFAGSRFADTAESTVKNETFKLGTGKDTITFDAKAGFGKDTVVLSNGENLTMSIMNGEAKYDAVSYNVKGNDVVVTADKVEYVLEATAKGTIADLKPGKVVRGTHGANFDNETVQFTLNKYALSQAVLDSGKYTEAQSALVGKYLWQSDFTYADVNYGTGKGQYEPCHVNLRFESSDFENNAVKEQPFDGVTYSNFKLYKVVNGVKTEIKDADLKTALLKDTADLVKDEFEGGSIVLKDFMKGGYNVNVVEGSSSKTLLEKLNGVEALTKHDFSDDKTYKRAVTYKGTILDEKITGTNFNDKIYAGAGKDTIDAGAGKNYISGGIGENTINIDIDDKANNTVELTKGEKLTININNRGHNIWGNYKTSVVGKDLVIGFYTDGADRFDTSKPADLGTLTIKNFANNNGGAEKLLIKSTGFEFDLISQQYRTQESSSWSEWKDIPTVMYDSTVNNSFMKSGKLTGSNLNEVFDASDYRKDATKIGKGVTINAGAGSDTITGSKHNDVIKTVSGTNTITAGAGNDKLYAGTGVDTFKFAQGSGADTLYASKAEGAESKLVFDGAPTLTYTKNGNDVLITATKDGKTDTVTVKDFLKKEDAYTVKIGESDFLKDKQLLVSGKGTIKGSFMDDKITGSDKADKIYAYGGTNEITANKGNDTIYVNTKDSTNTINIANGDGNDTVYTSKDSVTTLKYDTGDTLSYASKGKDLVITRSYGNDPQNPTTETTTIKDYFAQAGAGKLYTQIGDDGRKDVYNEASITYTDSSKSDVIELGNGNNTFNYTKGDDEYTSGTGSDTYNVKYTSSADLLITDKGGSDTLKITNTTKDDLALLFNVDKSGKIIVTTDEDGEVFDSLGIFSKTATYSAKKGLSGGIIEIDGFFKATPGSDPTVIPGDGYIETIKVGDGAKPWEVTIDSLNSIAQAVHGWFNDHQDKGYADANAVFSSDNTADIQSLLTAYQGTYIPKGSESVGTGA